VQAQVGVGSDPPPPRILRGFLSNKNWDYGGSCELRCSGGPALAGGREGEDGQQECGFC